MRINFVNYPDKVKNAQNVMKAIQCKILDMPNDENCLVLEKYQSGQEQGFLIINYAEKNRSWVAFSDNNDDIVVYPSTKNEPVPSREISEWKIRKSFKDTDAAADFCIKHLLG